MAAMERLFVVLALALVFAGGSQPVIAYERPPARKSLSLTLSDDLDSTSPQQLAMAILLLDSNALYWQVHISLVGQDKMRISWITDDPSPATVKYGTSPGVHDTTATGSVNSYDYVTYDSGEIHYVDIGPLKPNTQYYYICGSDLSPELSFKTPPAQFPIKFAVSGDLGQTDWTRSTLDHIAKSNYDVMLLPGDLSYADTIQPFWDSFGRLVEPLASKRPWMVTQGNHEIEKIPLIHSRSFTAYNARWYMPYEQSGSDSNLYYSFEVAGVHVIMLGSYTDFDPSSAQYKWLQNDLKKVDRSKTPWLIVLIHAPWYNSNTAHQGESQSVDMKADMEDLLYQARVDVVFAGHVHAYERFTRVYKDQANNCGPVHITIGDGGNREGLATAYIDPRPKISVFREASFGHGEFEVVNATHARWTWHRNEDDEAVVADSIWLTGLASGPSCKVQT